MNSKQQTDPPTLLMLLIRRFLVIVALMFWQGGFFFYASVVVPVGTRVFDHYYPPPKEGDGPSGKRQQGRITRTVAWWLNVSGAVALIPLGWDVFAGSDRGRRRGWRTLPLAYRGRASRCAYLVVRRAGWSVQSRHAGVIATGSVPGPPRPLSLAEHRPVGMLSALPVPDASCLESGRRYCVTIAEIGWG